MSLNQAAPIIEMRGLCRRFGAIRAVEGLDLTIYRGEIFGLVGPDGAGKTTTLRLLAAIMDPSSGTATVAGFNTVRQSEAIKRRIGYMAQQFSLYGDLSVWENLNFYADIFGVHGRDRRARIDRLLDFARLRQFRERRAVNLSGGMQKKLALACTLIHQPEILLLDEPTLGVDPVSRREFWDILAELHIAGTTILVSTPYMDEAERCSRVGLMYKGEIVRQGPPSGLRRLVRGELLAIMTRDLIGAQAAVEKLDGIYEVQVYGDRVHLFVDDAALREPLVRAALTAAHVQAGQIRKTMPRLEEAFISIVTHQEKAQAKSTGQE